MPAIHARTFRRTLTEIVETATKCLRPGERLEFWCFEDAAARRQAEADLAAQGIPARIRSAYKPLIHALLEDLPPTSFKSVRVVLPCHPAAIAGRFQLETYPLAGLIGEASLEFAVGSSPLDYRLDVTAIDGSQWTVDIFAPNRVRIDHLDESVLSPCGWLRIGHGPGAWRIDETVETEFEALFLDMMATAAAHPWGRAEPYFDRLLIEADIPAIARPLPYGDEVIDTAEALHEEIYFSLLEFFQRHSGRPLGSRDLRPGQIVPMIRQGEGDARLRISIEPFAEDQFDYEDVVEPLARAGTPLSPDRIARELAALGGDGFQATSREGRVVAGASFDGVGPGIAISGGQHPNEASGIVGALRAAASLKEAGRRFAVTPLENPDGYALHHRLRRDNPRHMHHAARYTAYGDDLGHRRPDLSEPDLLETAARLEAFRRSDCQLHINLHGYPAHEWTRPLTGYVPRGFGLWAVPKGFFLIMRHRDGLGAIARRLIERLAHRLHDELPEMVAFNAGQVRVYSAHVGDLPFEVIAGIPCQIGVAARATGPIELITEFPDETIYGDAFRLAHTSQFHAAIAAAEIFADLTT